MSDRDVKDYAIAVAMGALIGAGVMFAGRFSTSGVGWAHVLVGCVLTAFFVARTQKARRSD